MARFESLRSKDTQPVKLTEDKLLQAITDAISKPKKKTLDEALEDGTISLETYTMIKKHKEGQVPEAMEQDIDSVPDQIERELAIEDEAPQAMLDGYAQKKYDSLLSNDFDHFKKVKGDLNRDELLEKFRNEGK